jgi:thioredoxin:protein disulfide reductase
MRPQLGLRKLSWFGLALLTTVQSICAQTGDGPIVNISTVNSSNAVHPGDTIRVAAQVSLPQGWHVNARHPLDEFLIPTELILDPPAGVTVKQMAYPEAKTRTFEFAAGASMAVYESEFVIGAELEVAPDTSPGMVEVPAVLHYQACNETQCWAPETKETVFRFEVVASAEPITEQNAALFESLTFEEASRKPQQPSEEKAPAPPAPETLRQKDWQTLFTSFRIAGEEGGYIGAKDFLDWLDRVERGEGVKQGVLTGKSTWLVVVLTLVGGVLLNLTPCVLPLIPVNLAIIGAGAQAGSRKRGFGLGVVYGLAIAIVYGILGLAVVLGLGSFGTLNASPWFNLLIAVVFVILALAMFDVILIDFTRFQSKIGVKTKSGTFVFAFVWGGINALLAGACVAPVVFAVVLYAQDAYARGSETALGLPFLLGVGMGLPWPLAGAGLAMLPRPGKWMVRVKNLFGAFILALAAWYGYEAFTLFQERYLVDREAVKSSVEQMDQEGWVTSLPAGLALAKEENKPVFIDFWATWCKNCLVMNETTFQAAEVKKRLENYVKVKYQAEFPHEAPAKEVLAHMRFTGLPHYAVLEPKD